MADIPRSPTGLGVSGRALWTATLTAYELDEHECQLLREACRTADTLDALQAMLDSEGLVSQSSQGIRAHPALVELRQIAQQALPHRVVHKCVAAALVMHK